MNMKCQKCGSQDILVIVTAFLEIPIKMYGNLTKENIKKKDVQIRGADWGKASFLCKDCGYMIFIDLGEK
jgi:hypothetical protein